MVVSAQPRSAISPQRHAATPGAVIWDANVPASERSNAYPRALAGFGCGPQGYDHTQRRHRTQPAEDSGFRGEPGTDTAPAVDGEVGTRISPLEEQPDMHYAALRCWLTRDAEPASTALSHAVCRRGKGG
jgi:hypothetical protein